MPTPRSRLEAWTSFSAGEKPHGCEMRAGRGGEGRRGCRHKEEEEAGEKLREEEGRMHMDMLGWMMTQLKKYCLFRLGGRH
jgi:hypothetical protein